MPEREGAGLSFGACMGMPPVPGAAWPFSMRTSPIQLVGAARGPSHVHARCAADRSSAAACCCVSARPAASSASHSPGAMAAWAGARNRSSRAWSLAWPRYAQLLPEPARRAGEAGGLRAVAPARGDAGGYLQGVGQELGVAGTGGIAEHARQQGTGLLDLAGVEADLCQRLLIDRFALEVTLLLVEGKRLVQQLRCLGHSCRRRLRPGQGW